MRKLISVWTETAALAFLLVVVLVRVLDFPSVSEDENENDDDPKTHVSGQALIRLPLLGAGLKYFCGLGMRGGADWLEISPTACAHLRGRWSDRFGAQFDVLLCDLTSTYFECDVSDAEADPRRFGYPPPPNRRKRHSRPFAKCPENV